MSELISHAAFYNDVNKLARIRKSHHRFIVGSLIKFPDHGFFASSARGNHLYAVPLLEKAKNQQHTPSLEQENLKMVSAALGWNIHRAIDLITKPHSIKRTGVIAPSPGYSADEAEIYQDAITFRHILEDGRLKTTFGSVIFNELTLSDQFRDHPTGAVFRIEELESLVAGTVTAEMYGIHHNLRSVNTPTDAKASLSSGFQEYSEQFETYINAYKYQDQKRVEFYINRINFFDQNDPLIVLRKRCQTSEVSESELDHAMSTVAEQSLYAQAIGKALYFIQESNRFLKDQITKEQLYDAVENFHPPFRI